MSGGGGGGTTNSVTQPWLPADPFLRESLRGSQYAYQNPAPYYPGAGFVGPTAGEMSAWGQRLGYADQVFGGQPSLRYGDVTGATTRALRQGFGAPGTAGQLDARYAIADALGGMPDYAGIDAMAAAANAPITRQFYEEILPGLNERATFTNNPTGAIKSLQRILPDMGQRMSENAVNLYNTERLRALGSRDAAAGLVANMGQGLNRDALSAAGLFPAIGQLGAIPGDLSGEFAQWGRSFDEAALEDSMNRWNYYTGLPRENADWYRSAITPVAGLGGVTTGSNSGGSKLAGAIGGGLGGYALAQGLGSLGFGISNPVGWGITGLGALMGAFG